MKLWSLLLRVVGEILPVILLVTVTVAISADIIGRSGFRMPVFGARDVGLISFVFLVYLGIVGVARDDQMMGITYFRNRLVRTRRAAIALSHLIMMAISGFVVHAAWLQVTTGRFVRFDHLPLPKWIMAVSVLVGMSLVFIIYAGRFWQTVRGRGEPNRSEAAGGEGGTGAGGGPAG
jgi:TRAP-type C4-dicarboxylate transport system permease small subunit